MAKVMLEQTVVMNGRFMGPGSVEVTADVAASLRERGLVARAGRMRAVAAATEDEESEDDSDFDSDEGGDNPPAGGIDLGKG